MIKQLKQMGQQSENIKVYPIPYTHYWRIKQVPTSQEVQKTLVEVRKVLQCTKQIKLQFGFQDDDQPQIDKQQIRLNGIGYEDSQQSLLILWQQTEHQSVTTQRKSYDLVVCMILLACFRNIKSFQFKSDGRRKQWEPILQRYQTQVLGGQQKIDRQHQIIKALLRDAKTEDEQYEFGWLGLY